MNISTESRAETILQAALGYAYKGLSVIPLRGKKPAVTWVNYMVKAATFTQIHGWSTRGYLQNVGIVCGAVSSDLVVLDLDGVEAVNAFASEFPTLQDTFTIVTGSGKGSHVYFRCPNIDTTRAMGIDGIGNVELRSSGSYVVAAPSIHPDTGKMYESLNEADIMSADLSDVQQWIFDLIASKRPVLSDLSRERRKTSEGDDSEIEDKYWYGQKALHDECGKVRATYQAVNNQLYIAALKMGSLVTDGMLSAYEVETALFAAAQHLSERDGVKASIRTIRSGLKNGMSSSRLENRKA